MSIASIDHTLGKVTAFAGQESDKSAAAAQDASGTLAQITDGAKLSTLVPRLQAVLAEMAASEDNVLDALNKNVSTLQDGFIDALYSALTEESIDLSQKLTLRLSGDNTLVVAGEHPEKEAVEKALNSRPALATAFSEIAAQSELAKDITNINTVMTRQSTEKYAQMADNSPTRVYQMSLKGEMSHFYFGQPGD